MSTSLTRLRSLLAVVPLLFLFQTPTANGDNAELEKRIDSLESELQNLRQLLKKQQETQATKEEVDSIKQKVDQVGDVHDEWRQAKSVVHLAGYGDATYTDVESGDSSFNASFSPVFHYMYDELLMMETELEITIDDSGETDVALEYAALDLFVNDYAVVVAGKFLSPLGQFRQNLHPSWINKLPSAPIGFGHDGAAPISDVGVQVRGGFPVGSGGMRANYAAFVANGPRLVLGDEHGDEHGDASLSRVLAQTEDEHGDEADEHGDSVGPMDDDEHGDEVADEHGDEALDEHGDEALDEHAEEIAAELNAEGTSADLGDTKVFGGRLGLVMPFFSTLEIGLSAAIGEVPVVEDGLVAGEPERDYDVLGADFSYQRGGNIDVRGEWIRQKVDSDSRSALLPRELELEAWYLQAAYKFLPSKWELVGRYGEFDTNSDTQEQWALGLNYLFAGNVIAKLAFESNDDRADRILAQLAYGY